jgi:LCP family protein required for cell wall assembly
VFKRAALAAVLIVLATAGAVSAAILLQVKQAVTIFVRNSHPIPHIHNVLADVSTGGPQTILVLGSDRRWSDIKQKIPARSDTMMLLRLDPGKGATSVLSVPRDLKVQIPTKRGYVTDKINAAYSIGGPALAVRTVTNLLHIPINHVVNVNFGGFQRAVNRLGCVYVDVDRRYYHSNLGLPPSEQYSEININAGYQKLCGADALAYVRYRHNDTDLVRAARQQDFLRQAKEQFSLGRLFGDRDELLKIFGRYTETDISSTEAILRLLKLAFESAKNPIQEIHFPVTEQNTKQGDYLLTTPANVQKVVDRFLNAHASSGPRSGQKARPGDSSLAKKQKRKQHLTAYTTRYPGVFADSSPAQEQATRVAAKAGFPVYYPTYAALGSEYLSDLKTPRVYTIADRSHRRYRAYRIVVQAPGFGQYYGIQGTSAAVYWVSNTLLETLTNHQMYGIARSLRRLGS